MNIFIYPNFEKNNAFSTTLKSIEILKEANISVYMDIEYKTVIKDKYIQFDEFEKINKQVDIIIVIGGDGTILKASKLAAKYKKPLLGINTGRLGFMASIETADLDKLKLLLDGNYTKTKRMMLSVKVSGNKKETEYIALNDAALSRIPSVDLPEFEIISNNEQVSKVRADGIIFSTPTGSTAYALSAGGPIIEPSVECIEVTQICAHSLFSRPMIFSADKTLLLKTKISNNKFITLQIDGVCVAEIDSETTISVTQSELYTEIIEINGSAFYKAIDKKLMTPIK